MIKKNNKYIQKARKKNLFKKIIVVVLLTFIGIIIFITKSNFFIIKKISILGNPVISGDQIKSETENLIGKNIFFVKQSDIIKEVEKNPYVEDVKIKKVFPKQINITVSEKEGIYYVDNDTSKYILNDKLILLEKTDNVDNKNLVKIQGITFDEDKLGSKVLQNKRIENLLETVYQIIKNNPTNYKIDCIDVSDLTNIKVYIGNVEGKLGNDEDIINKMNKLFHIISSPEVNIKKGYIDVGFDGAPIYYSE